MRIIPALLVSFLLIAPQLGFAQSPEPTPSAAPPRAFVDVNLIGSASSPSGSRVFTGRFVTFGEAGISNAIYPKPATKLQLPAIDVGVGYMTGTLIGLGLYYSRLSFDDAVRLATSVPHPQVLNAAGAAEGLTNRELSRDETMLSINAVVVPLKTERREARIVGGFSYFWLDAEMVSNVSYSQTATLTPLTNTIAVTGFTVERSKGRSLGFNAGVDYTHFFSRMVGAKAGVRFSHANVDMPTEPLSRRGQKLKVGGLMFFLGARFRFGN